MTRLMRRLDNDEVCCRMVTMRTMKIMRQSQMTSVISMMSMMRIMEITSMAKFENIKKTRGALKEKRKSTTAMMKNAKRRIYNQCHRKDDGNQHTRNMIKAWVRLKAIDVRCVVKCDNDY